MEKLNFKNELKRLIRNAISTSFISKLDKDVSIETKTFIFNNELIQKNCRIMEDDLRNAECLKTWQKLGIFLYEGAYDMLFDNIYIGVKLNTMKDFIDSLRDCKCDFYEIYINDYRVTVEFYTYK